MFPEEEKKKKASNSADSPGSKKTQAEQINENILKMLTRANIPFAFVGDPFFKHLTEKAYPKFKLRDRKFFAAEVLPKVSKEIIDDLKAKLSSNYCSITSDGWSAKGKPSPEYFR